MSDTRPNANKMWCENVTEEKLIGTKNKGTSVVFGNTLT